MKTVFLSLILALFMMGTVPAPANAQYQVQGHIDQTGHMIPVAAGGRSISDMNLEHLIAVGVGAALGVAAADVLLGGGGIITIVGLVGGALAGNAYYLEGLWPFH